VQAAAVPVVVPGPLSWQEKLEPVSVEVKANDGALLLVAPDGPPVIVVSGGEVSVVPVPDPTGCSGRRLFPDPA
jgi:hypothetical protein